MMKIIFLGPPGSGKGTQADFICESFHIPRISTGDMLRDAIIKKTPLGVKISSLMKTGELISDDIVINLVKERIVQPDCKDGFLLDGFPRTIPQAEELEFLGIAIDYIVEITIEDEAVIKRMTGRRFHPPSGRSYHILYNPPKAPNVDDVTGEPLAQRHDDREDTVKYRLEVYRGQTYPLINYYKKKIEQNPENAPHFITIDGSGAVSEVKDRIFKALVK